MRTPLGKVNSIQRLWLDPRNWRYINHVIIIIIIIIKQSLAILTVSCKWHHQRVIKQMAAFTKLSQSPAFSFFPLVYAHVFKMTWTIIFYYKLRSQNLRFLLTRAQLLLRWPCNNAQVEFSLWEYGQKSYIAANEILWSTFFADRSSFNHLLAQSYRFPWENPK